jgi:cell division protein FtsL
MEKNTPNNDERSFMDQSKKKNSKPVVLILLIVILLGAIGIMSVMYYNLKMDSQEQVQLLEEEKNRLTSELKNLYFDYDSLKTENDSINIHLEAEQEKIERLLSINASNVSKIRLYKKELKTLRDIMKSYIIQIDSLNQRNKQLSEENIKVRKELYSIEESKKKLEEEKEELSSKVEIATVLNAKDINADPLNKRSREKDKISKVEKIRTCFTLRENPIIEPGEKVIYIRIYRPDGVVLASPDEGTFEFDGEQIMYSAKRSVEYENQDIDVCIYWDRTEPLIEGEYIVELYAENNLLGSDTFLLRSTAFF